MYIRPSYHTGSDLSWLTESELVLVFLFFLLYMFRHRSSRCWPGVHWSSRLSVPLPPSATWQGQPRSSFPSIPSPIRRSMTLSKRIQVCLLVIILFGAEVMIKQKCLSLFRKSQITICRNHNHKSKCSIERMKPAATFQSRSKERKEEEEMEMGLDKVVWYNQIRYSIQLGKTMKNREQFLSFRIESKEASPSLSNN